MNLLRISSLILAAAVSAASLAQLKDTHLNDLLGKKEISLGEAAVAVVVSEALDLDTKYLLSRAARFEAPYWDYADIFSLERKSGKSASEIAALRAQGHGWGVIAKKIGMHPGEFNKMRKSGGFGRQLYYSGLNRKGVPMPDIKRAEDRGMTIEEIVIAGVLSGGKRDKFEEILKERSAGQGWDTKNLGKPDKWSKPRGKAKAAPGKSKGKGRGKGRGR
jgi:hypothetical protein